VPIKNQNYETIDVPTIQVNHLADVTKSRSSYLPLLELSVKEDPTDDRNMHYLGREYMFHGDYNKAITTLLHHLSLPSAKWDAERSASLRYIANCYSKKEDKENQEKYLLLSILECSNMRESYFQLATFYYEQKDYLKSAFIFEEMLKIKNKELNYISSPVCWGSIPYDYLSLCYFELKKYDKSFYYISQALNFEPNNERLKNNKKIIQNYLKI